ncbi:hypothetical protein K1719_006729 [Acacia pycnantha]|nr:hypothetical protein K1719_006729 [Acacia pycnantha]
MLAGGFDDVRRSSHDHRGRPRINLSKGGDPNTQETYLFELTFKNKCIATSAHDLPKWPHHWEWGNISLWHPMLWQ